MNGTGGGDVKDVLSIRSNSQSTSLLPMEKENNTLDCSVGAGPRLDLDFTDEQ